MREQAEAVGLPGPEAANLTTSALRAPCLGVEMPLRVKRCNDIIAMGSATLGVFPGAREMKSYALQQGILLSTVGIRCHGPILKPSRERLFDRDQKRAKLRA